MIPEKESDAHIFVVVVVELRVRRLRSQLDAAAGAPRDPGERALSALLLLVRFLTSSLSPALLMPNVSSSNTHEPAARRVTRAWRHARAATCCWTRRGRRRTVHCCVAGVAARSRCSTRRCARCWRSRRSAARCWCVHRLATVAAFAIESNQVLSMHRLVTTTEARAVRDRATRSAARTHPRVRRAAPAREGGAGCRSGAPGGHATARVPAEAQAIGDHTDKCGDGDIERRL